MYVGNQDDQLLIHDWCCDSCIILIPMSHPIFFDPRFDFFSIYQIFWDFLKTWVNTTRFICTDPCPCSANNACIYIVFYELFYYLYLWFNALCFIHWIIMKNSAWYLCNLKMPTQWSEDQSWTLPLTTEFVIAHSLNHQSHLLFTVCLHSSCPSDCTKSWPQSTSSWCTLFKTCFLYL